MRALCAVLVLAACHHETVIVRAMDPKCYTPCWEGPGHPGVGTCTEGTWQCDDNGDLTECKGMGTWQHDDPCDGLDNNCDGIVDHEYGQCVTGCGTGMHQCVNGQYPTECYNYNEDPPRLLTPVPETCNGIDDDCNGLIDDLKDGQGLPLACYSPGNTGLGICHPGTFVCQGNTQICSNEQLPKTEVCNGLDDNCNGKVDDGLGGTADVVVIADCDNEDFDDEVRLGTALHDMIPQYTNNPSFQFALVCTTTPNNDGVVSVYKNFVEIDQVAPAADQMINYNGEDPESTLDALLEVSDPTNPLHLNWHAGSQRYIVMWTDECGVSNLTPPADVGVIESQIDQGHYHTYIYTVAGCESSFGNVTTNGGFGDIGSLPTELAGQLESVLSTTCQP